MPRRRAPIRQYARRSSPWRCTAITMHRTMHAARRKGPLADKKAFLIEMERPDTADRFSMIYVPIAWPRRSSWRL